MYKTILRQAEKNIPLGFISSPEQFANLITFLINSTGDDDPLVSFICFASSDDGELIWEGGLRLQGDRIPLGFDGRLWNETDQREWVYDDEDWRDKLKFDKQGLVIGDYMKDVLKGKWVSEKPHNKLFHGYHIPQYIVPTIPLTIDDAVNKYKLSLVATIEKIYSL